MSAGAHPGAIEQASWGVSLERRVETDTVVLFLVGALMTLGVVMVYSASVTLKGPSFDWRDILSTPLRQGLFALTGFLAAVLVAQIDYRLLAWERRWDGWAAIGLYLVAVALLVAVLMPGVGEQRLGAQRAIVLMSSPFSISFQPSEFAKVALIVWLAALLTRPQVELHSLRHGYVPALLSAGVIITLTGIEDFGTAALMGVVTMCMLVVAGARWSHLGGTALLGIIGAIGLLLARPYRVQRIVTFLSEAPNPSNEGYQIVQSLIAIGSGGWFGRGLGAGVQKYGYLPQDNNDFIFAILCEELGAVGGLFVVALFVLLLLRGWQASRHAVDGFGRLLAAGVTLMISLQAAFNIAVVTDSVPTKGISLPFVSAGGSGVLFLGLAVGLLASVSGIGQAARRQEPALG